MSPLCTKNANHIQSVSYFHKANHIFCSKYITGLSPKQQMVAEGMGKLRSQ